MKTSELLDQVLGHVRLIKDDKEKLETLLEFLNDQLADYQEEEPEELPLRFEKIIQPIAEAIDAGMTCFLNMDTQELVKIHPVFQELEDEENEDDENAEYLNWPNCFEISTLDSQESFEIMESFVSQLKDIPMQNQLIRILDGKKPFANFKQVVQSSSYQQAWYDFKEKALAQYVRTQLYLHINYGKGVKAANNSEDPHELPF
jgi:hypothetical protein